MITAVRCSVLLCMMVACGHVLAYPYNGDNMHPGAGAMGNHHQQPGFGGSVGQQRGYGGDARFGGGNFGRSPAYGGQSRWQSTGYGGQQQGAEAYQTNIFNEPDRYGYDYTIPGATVHFLMYKKQGNRESGNNHHNFGVDSSGWDKRY
ncbi:keratin, type II cytoskeletal 2 epidermal-like [Myzus persicae]|uniref:keratin, type II cytoskeletal 2 epidermal-like n=1 Tax=Myzus persicae TaxID=13164 RepID=UPI000B936BEA|nr:keratin, type II cytoskeletal 2 epidermal-like [Myzus persicae]